MVTEVGGEVKRRKSARLLALEEEKKNKACAVESETAISENQTHVRTGTSTSRRGKRKKLEDVVLSSPQDSEDARDEDYSIYDDEAAYLSYLQEDPETPVLELILDILQRRDTCNLFAKPVDPQEVWTHYRIIKEPVDFGTIRTKLQEGNYKSLEQFEHDVNLISTNAMHFNASTTVIYQEAQAIQELAQQLFRSLRADPEQFKLQFLPTKRSPGRKPQNHGRGSQRRVGRPSSSRGPYVRRKSRAGSSTANSSGMINSRNSNSLGMERRETYRLSKENKSLLSVVCDSAKILLHVDNGDSGYKEGLMKFAQNLGPTAQRLVESKLAQLNQSPNFQPQATHSIQTQNCMAPALPVLAFPAPEVPGHLLDGNDGQIHRGSPYYVHNSDSNASNFHGDASAQGYAGISNCGMHISDTANVTNLNPPSSPQLGMVPNYRDKGKMVVDFSQNMELGGTGDTEARDYSLNHNSNLRLESHIHVLRDFTSPGTSSSGMKFRAVDMLGKPNPLENQQQFQHVHQLPSCTGTSSGSILSWAVNRLADTSRQENQQLQPAQLSSTGSPNQSNLVKIMAGRSTYLKPSSSSLRSPSSLLSSLSEAPTSWNDFGSQLNNNAAKSAQTGQQLQWSQCGAEQNMQENGSYLEMLGEISGQCKKSTLPRIEHLGEGNYSWGSNTFVKNDQQFGEVNCQLGNSTSMRKENAQWGSNAFLRKEHLANGNFQQKNKAFLNRAFMRQEPETDDLGNSTCLWKERQLEGENVQLGNSTLMRKKRLNEANFQVWSSTSLTEQSDHGTCLQGDTSFMSKVPQVDRNSLQMGNSTFMSNVQVLNEGSFRQGNSTFMSNEQVLNEGSFRQDNSTFMSKGQLPEGSFQLGKSSCMMTEQQIDKVNDQWWNNTLISKNQQLCDRNNQLGST